MSSQRLATSRASTDLSGDLATHPPSLAPRSISPNPDAVAPLKPEEYATAVFDYAWVPTGAGMNYRVLSAFLKSEKITSANSNRFHTTNIDYDNDGFVTLYLLGGVRRRRRNGDIVQGSIEDQNNDGTPLQDDTVTFTDPQEFYTFGRGVTEMKSRSRLVFLRGFMPARWLNSIGARDLVDPEFFARHLDFRDAGDPDNTYSLPALPSASWHLIELPLMTLGVRSRALVSMTIEDLEDARRFGAKKLSAHHKKIRELSRSDFRFGDSLVRDFHVFDETHFAIEQRVSICLTEAVDGGFGVFIWLDGGREFDKANEKDIPWSLGSGDSHYVPIIKHKNMIALKSQKAMWRDKRTYPKHVLSASLLHRDYGRSLRPSVMATDALYALAEVFSFVSSSEMAFLNLIEEKLDKYTESSGQEFDMLPNLKYVTRILYRHIQKMDRILDSLNNTSNKKWPKANNEGDYQKASGACKDLVQDFTHLRSRAQQIHTRCHESITIHMSSMAIAESKKVMKLTFLAFIFVPLSFTTSFFGMNVREFNSSSTSLWWWAAFSIPVFGFPFIGLFFGFRRPFTFLWSLGQLAIRCVRRILFVRRPKDKNEII